MQPTVSVIIAAYNVAEYIERAVASGLAQEGVDVEIIIVDDRSTDNTWQVISAFTDPRIKTIQASVNSGPGLARNIGFEKATGEWVAVLDADDHLSTTRLRDCVNAADSADIVVDNLIVERLSDGHTYPMFPADAFAKRTKLDLPTFISGKLSRFTRHSLGYLKPVFRTSFLRQYALHYKPDLRIGEDYLLLAEAIASGGVCAINHTPGYYYTVRGGSISHRLTPQHLRQMIAADDIFTKRFALSGEALRANKVRRFLLAENLSYTELVAALKLRSPYNAICAIARHPTSIRHLWEPVWKRISGIIR